MLNTTFSTLLNHERVPVFYLLFNDELVGSSCTLFSNLLALLEFQFSVFPCV